ncbi:MULTISPECIES: hypothetical protein [Acinetobacter]|jgi:hypothetical protein|uniref:Uncharacterized protein n=3 Tax=Gammaproteobacteria TaxID=1236 RepID=N8XGU6_ACIBZ|nr:hypothetical protein [Acinetobacter bereziniae]ENV23757.1 hypothetical protein F963_00213 [Acinetobacter bereziniae NIPH 3]TNL42397.1 hypothetical protein EYB59_22595 [Acinetobacter bereziniae]TNL48871.1 hypothetical protein EYY58_22120 [Acinetobacter bereziniae]
MDICSWDWGAIGSIAGAIATFTGAGVALFISWQWKHQKASEVIANEAKKFIVNLSILQSLQSEIHKIIYESNGYNGANKEIDNFKETHKLLNDSAVMLGESLKDTAISHYSTTVMAQAIIFEKDIDKYKNGEISLDKIRLIDPNDAKIITDIYIGYALYKKTI